MRFLTCCIYGLSLLVLPTITLPTTPYNAPLPSLPPPPVVAEEYMIDVHKFSLQLSTHLLYNPIDIFLTSISKRISLHFQNLVQVTTETVDLNSDFVVDVDLLKGQLQGAVGSFIEDSLPPIWNTRGLALEKANLLDFIEKTTTKYCSVQQSNTCIESNATSILSTIDEYIRYHLINMIHIVVTQDLPPIFKTTQTHVNGILAHFGHYLEQQQRRSSSSMHTTTNTNTIVIYNQLDNIEDMIHYLQSHIDHISFDNSILNKFLLLSKEL